MSEVKFGKMRMSNFLVYGQGPFEFDFDMGTTALIIGDNKDGEDEGSSRNGCGKSTIFQGLMFALFGQGISKLKNDEFINFFNGKRTWVELYFFVGDQQYRILRGRKPNKLELYQIDGDEETSLTLDSMANTNSLIEKIIGFSYNVFMLSYFLSPKKQSFLSLGTPDQRAIVEEVFSLDVLSSRAADLKTMKSDVEVDLKLAKKDVENAEHINEKSQQSYDRLLKKFEEFDDDNRKEIDRLEAVIDEYKGVDFSEIASVFQKIDSTMEQLNNAKNEVHKLAGQKSDLESKIHSLETKLSKEQHIRDNLKELKKKKDQKEEENKKKKQELEESLNEYPSIKELEEAKELVDEYENALRQLKEVERDIKDLQKDVSLKEDKKKEYEEELENLQEGICFNCGQSHYNKDREQELESSIKQVSKKIHDAFDEANRLSDKKKELENVDDPRITKDEINEAIQDIRSIEQSIETLFNPYTDQLKQERANLKELEEDSESVREEVEQTQSDRQEVDLDLVEREGKIEQISDELEKLDEKAKSYGFRNYSQVEKKLNELDNAKETIKSLKNKENPYKEELEQVEFVDVEQEQAKVKQLEDDLTHIGYLVKLLTDPKSFVRKKIVDQFLPYLNKRINEYTGTLGLAHVVEIKPDLSTDIEYMGKGGVSYHSLSGGETIRLDISVAMAFRDLLSIMGKKTNVLLIDELFDSGGDPSLINRAFKFVRGRADTTLIISHREEFLETIDKKILVTKQGGYGDIQVINT